MRFNRMFKRGLALAGALTLLSAAAAHAADSWTLSSYVHDAYANSSTTTDYGSAIPASQTTTMPTGWRIAHADDATSPFGSSSPVNGDTVATGTANAKWQPFCSQTGLPMTGKWVEPIDSGAPANTVAQINMQTTIFTTKVFITKTSSGPYKIETPNMPSSVICSGGANSTSVTVDGTVSGTTRHVSENPTATGTYCESTTWTDTSSVTHNPASLCVTIT